MSGRSLRLVAAVVMVAALSMASVAQARGFLMDEQGVVKPCEEITSCSECLVTPGCEYCASSSLLANPLAGDLLSMIRFKEKREEIDADTDEHTGAVAVSAPGTGATTGATLGSYGTAAKVAHPQAHLESGTGAAKVGTAGATTSFRSHSGAREPSRAVHSTQQVLHAGSLHQQELSNRGSMAVKTTTTTTTITNVAINSGHSQAAGNPNPGKSSHGSMSHGRRLHSLESMEAERQGSHAALAAGSQHRAGGRCMSSANAQSGRFGQCGKWATEMCDCAENAGKGGCPDPNSRGPVVLIIASFFISLGLVAAIVITQLSFFRCFERKRSDGATQKWR